MNRVLLITLAIALHICLQAQTRKPITHEDMWLMQRVGAPAVSPDGKSVIFNVLEASYDEKEQVSDIWIAATDGSTPPRKLTAGKSAESGYTWSPDSKCIAFSAKREGDEVSQIYILNVREGGEAQRLTKLCTGANSPQWSPDGKQLLFISKVFPLCYADSLNKKAQDEKKKVKYNARVYTGFPIQDFDKWVDELQNHAFVQSLESKSEARDLFTDVKMSTQPGFRFYSAIWSPNGKNILFTASDNAHTGAYQEPSSRLYSVSLTGGDAQKLSPDDDNYGSPQLSRDGKYLFCNTNRHNDGQVYDMEMLTRFDYPSMRNKTLLNKSLDRAINKYVVTPQAIIMSVEDSGNDYIYTVALDGNQPKKLSKNAGGSMHSVHASMEAPSPVIIAAYESAVQPPELVRLDPITGEGKNITNFNKTRLDTLDMLPAESFWTTTSKGKKIHSLLIKPAGFKPEGKYPLFVLLHGGPAASSKDIWSYRWNYHLLAKAGFVIIATDYTGSTGYGEQFSQAILNDPFKGPGEEIREAAADAMKRFSFIDTSRQAAGGASYGGHLANWMQATTTHYKCLVSHAGLVNSVTQYATSDYIFGREIMNGGAPWLDSKIWKEQNPFTYASSFQTPMLITIGEIDYRVPISNSIENWHILQRKQIPSKLIVFPEENHWILKAENSRFFYKELENWLAKYLLVQK